MAKANWDRLASLSGLAFIVLLIVSNAIFSPPALSKSNGKILAYFTNHHRAGLISGILAGLAVVAFVWFLGSLATTLREAGEQRLAATAFGTGLVVAGLAMVGTLIQTALVFRVAADSPDTVRALYDVGALTFGMIGFPIAGMAAATGIAAIRSRVFPEWCVLACGAVAVVSIVGGIALKTHGFFSPTGAMGLIKFIVFLAWVLLTTGALWMHAKQPHTMARPAHASM